ncbi:MAG TPA: cell division protein FtsL [Firmicutes bacterium]|nr:cell division protein FtsL [Bacillota bacterium]
MLIAKEKPIFTYQEQGFKKRYVPGQKSFDLPRPRERRIPVHRESLLLCSMLLCLIIIGVGLITQYGHIVAGNYRLHQMRREIALLQEENEQLLLEVKRLGSLDRIEAIAANELGLQYPEKRQWLFLSAGN